MALTKAQAEQLKLLRAADDGTLPKVIGRGNPDFSFDMLRELCDAGVMIAKYVSALATADQEFRDPRIMLRGRTLLAELEQLAIPDQAREPAEAPGDDDKKWFKKPLGIVALTVVSGTLVALVLFVMRFHFGIAL